MFFVDQSLINLEEQNIETFNPFHATDLFFFFSGCIKRSVT